MGLNGGGGVGYGGRQPDEGRTAPFVSFPIKVALSSLERENASVSVCCVCSVLINPACALAH